VTSSTPEQETAKYIESTPTSRELQGEAENYLPGGSSRGTAYFAPYPIFVERGKGHYIHDVDGNRYLDFMLNATSLIMGHAHPEITRALTEQAARGVAFSAPTAVQVRLAELLCERIPSMELVRFASSGTEATLNAIRVARAYTGKYGIAKFEGGYHGSHEYASISVHPPYEKLDPDGPTAVPEYPGMPPSVLEGVVVLPYNDLAACETILRERHRELACVIMEAVVSNFGYAPAQIDFLRGMRDLTRELGMLLILDEVQSFRIAPGGAQEALGVEPDLTALGKIIGGGMPAGAFGGRRDIMSLFDPGRGEDAIPHAGTFNANPMTMVGGEATMRHLTDDVYERMNRLGGTLRAKLQAVFDELDVPAQVTGIASFFGMHFTGAPVTDYRSMLAGDQQMTKALFVGLLNEGVLLQQSCAGSLSTLTTEGHVDGLVDAVRRVVTRIRG
jgi:glutamate-1-semialdehyde 2,1-aminomutase